MTKNLIETVLISNKDYKALLQERDELKKACEKCKLFDIEKTNRDLLERIDKLEQENKENIHYLACMTEQRNKLKSALEEIKHILEIHKDELEECLHNDINGMIQNKINEVLQ